MKKIIVSLFVLIATVGSFAASGWTTYTVPHPIIYNCKVHATYNPKGYPYCQVQINNGIYYGFFLDGSEFAKNTFALLQAACIANRTVSILYNTSFTEVFTTIDCQSEGAWSNRVVAIQPN